TVQTQIKTVSDQASATASQTTQLQTTVNGHTQQFQQQASINQDVNGKITGTYSFRFKFDVNGSPYSTGVGLGIETGANGQVTSRFVIQADQFAIYNGAVGAAGSSVPFAVNGTETYIKSAFIQDGTITNAKIGNYIQSNNYDPGKAGWKLFFDGTFEINSSLGSGQARQVINNAGGKVFDAGGIKRYQWGDLNA
ncbi:phage tail tip fiber protein, partial [Pseudomonas fluorescens]